MKLCFVGSHLSIQEFPDVEIPDFLLLTGSNGAGKSHLLQALKNGNLRYGNQDESFALNDIRLYDWNSLVPQDTGIFQSEVLKNEVSGVALQFVYRSLHQNGLEPLRALARRLHLPSEYIADPQALSEICDDNLSSLLPVGTLADVRLQLIEANALAANVLLADFSPTIRRYIQDLATARNKPVPALRERDFLAGPPLWGEADVFQQSFARLFVAYRDAWLENQLAQFMASKGQRGLSFVSDDEFVRLYGPPPWEFVNSSMRAAGLDFEINHPTLNSHSPFQPALTKKGSSISIQFANLSSGEKVLMSFAFCVYYSQDRRQLAAAPKLLLLDEVDAPLHPSMSKNLIDTIQKSLVEKFAIKVIATTHSPSTVALSPDEAIFVMQPGVPGIRKSSKASALNVLTVGVPTLAISFEGRRQVFVESSSDAVIYEAIYKLLKPKIRSERSLEFIATGTRSSDGSERNSGCENVRRLVESLSAAGNLSVFGLIDWDGKNSNDARLAVLAEGRRNGLESTILDPLAIALLICRDFSDWKSKIGLHHDDTIISLSLIDPERLRVIAGAVVREVLGAEPGELFEAEYVGGFSLSLEQAYFRIDDHLLEQKLLLAFPPLNSLVRERPGAGRLMRHVIKTVYTDIPDAVPIELHDAFVSLLERETH
ncbi:AAA family ATPase [Rhodopseudomonas sp. AAP120]|uniref:AAA family ATPase n=1 Tax=Rhodopseudomonas sp. AAP120 TaxID=1523430 RepID=UPI0009E82302|nr:AAA family ATPase [Rhodopseudomonas sp. AAP120]